MVYTHYLSLTMRLNLSNICLLLFDITKPEKGTIGECIATNRLKKKYLNKHYLYHCASYAYKIYNDFEYSEERQKRQNSVNTESGRDTKDQEGIEPP